MKPADLARPILRIFLSALVSVCALASRSRSESGKIRPCLVQERMRAIGGFRVQPTANIEDQGRRALPGVSMDVAKDSKGDGTLVAGYGLDIDVAIGGAAPVGLALAAFPVRRGVEG